MSLLGGRLCEVEYINPYSPFYKFLLLLQSRGGEALALVPLSYASDSGAARICERGPKRGSGGRVWEGVPTCMKMAFSCTLNFIRDSLCSGTDQFPTLLLFLLKFVSGKHFLYLPPHLFSSFFPFFLLADQQGGPWPPCATPLATPVAKKIYPFYMFLFTWMMYRPQIPKETF